MKIEKISENKIRIIFDYKELEENNISVHSFLSNSIESQKLFLAILDIANEDFGFDISNSKISYETFSFNNKTFVIFVTKSNNNLKMQYSPNLNPQKNKNISATFRDTSNSKSSHFNFIGDNLLDLKSSPSNDISSDILLYKFKNMDEVFSFCDFINNCLPNLDLKNSLYKYNNMFFIKINLETLNINKKKMLISTISEFKNSLLLSNLGLIRLEEFGNILIKNNAIQVL